MRYHLKAIDVNDDVIDLRIDAASESAARDLARQQGYSVVSAGGGGWDIVPLFRSRGRVDTALFSIELLALLDAGLNLVEALQALSEKGTVADTRRVLVHVLEALYRGEPFSKALTFFPEHFSTLYVATVQSAERTGNLKEALSRFVAYQEELDKVKKKLVAASIYPTILMVAGTLVLGFLLFYVVPRFAIVYNDVSIQLPFFSAALLSFGRWLQNHAVWVCVFAAGIVALALYSLSRNSMRTRLAAQLWRVPALGERMKTYQIARLYRTVGMLLRAGVPVVQSLQMVSGLLAPHLRAALMNARALLEEGKPVSVAFAAAALTTPVAVRMLRVGEQSGQMGELMDRIARFCDDETARWVDAFMRAFEPILMTLLGVAVGLVVVLMYMPVFELAGSLQ